MTKKPSRVRILMMPFQDGDDRNPAGYSGPATVLTGLPRTIRRHELRLIVRLADSTIYEMETRRLPPPLQSYAPLRGVGSGRGGGVARTAPPDYLAGRTKIAPGPDVRQRKDRPVKAQEADI
jgi:prophage regulatory protein